MNANFKSNGYKKILHKRICNWISIQLTDERMFCGSSTQPRSKFKSFTQLKRCSRYPIDPKNVVIRTQADASRPIQLQMERYHKWTRVTGIARSVIVMAKENLDTML
jgi:hypothetical protein